MSRATRYAKKHDIKTGPVIHVPKLETYRARVIANKTPTFSAGKVPRKVKASIERREIREAKKLKGETGFNMRVTGTLARRFPNKLSLIMEQANAAYHYRNPGVENNPEPYELSEGGFIDEALDSLGLSHVKTHGS
jgi:hypothetical protein